MKVIRITLSLALCLTAAACAATGWAGFPAGGLPPIVKFKNGVQCAVPAPDVVVTGRELKGQAKALGRVIADASISDSVKLQRIQTELPEVNSYDRLEFRLCLARGSESITPGQYQDAISGLLSKLRAGATGELLVIDQLTMNSTPQSGTWLFCLSANAANSSNVYHVPNREYKDDGVEIKMGLKLPNVPIGSTVRFAVNLDDDESDVCAPSAEDKTSSTFQSSRNGSQTFTDGKFRYVLAWHSE